MVRELVILRKNAAARRYPLLSDAVTIGRSSTNTLSFPDEIELSRQHSMLQKREEGWTLIDLASSNGTLLNGVPITGEVLLSEGDRFYIGGVTFVCAGDDEGTARAEAPPPPEERIEPADAGNQMVFPGRKSRVIVSDPTPFAYGRASALFRAATAETEICVKLFPNVQGDQWENTAAFEREVLAQSSLDHPHVLPVLDYGLQSLPHGNPFVVLPYCRGGSIRGLLRERTFYPLSVVLPLLQQIAGALDFAHCFVFIHGDVKPENILLSGDRKVAYLSDFGMSNVFAVQERFTTQIPGAQGGTTAYLSPEQISANQQTPLSDVYAFAVAAYELLTGRLPFDQNLPTFQQMLAKIKGEIIDPRLFSPQISDTVKAALLAGLNVDPLKRPPTASALCSLMASPATADRAEPKSTASPRRSSVFISYSHRDSSWLERIRIHLRPLEREGLLELWDDTRIRPGSDWRGEISRALDGASTAVLLLSAHFLASDFCSEEELPRLLERAADRGVSILPVFVSPCHLGSSPVLSALQAVNPPSRTLVEMDAGEQERLLAALVGAIRGTF